jgi:hypothetical protein
LLYLSLLCLLLAARRLNLVLGVGCTVLSVFWCGKAQRDVGRTGLTAAATVVLVIAVFATLGALVTMFRRESVHESYIRGIPAELAVRAQRLVRGNVRVFAWDAAVFGRGLGTNSLGSKYVAGYDMVRSRPSSEDAHGGLGAIFNELGAVGLLLYGWLWFALYVPGFRAAHRARGNREELGLTFPLLAWMTCWLAIFVQTHGVLGDGGSATLFYFSAGVLLRLCQRETLSARPPHSVKPVPFPLGPTEAKQGCRG